MAIEIQISQSNQAKYIINCARKHTVLTGKPLDNCSVIDPGHFGFRCMSSLKLQDTRVRFACLPTLQPIHSAFSWFSFYNRRECTKYETCAILHRFHNFYVSCDCDSKRKPSRALYILYPLNMLSANS